MFMTRSRHCNAIFNLIALFAQATCRNHNSTFTSFSSHSIGFPCPVNYNPADFFIRTLAVSPTEYEQSLERIKVSCFYSIHNRKQK